MSWGVTPRPWSTPVRTRPGRPYPLGATWDGAGVNFALFSENATGVELCMFDGDRETRVPVTERTEGVWHVYLPEARPGLRYGYRVQGPWDPAAGHRFNAAKLLLDPYARGIDGAVRWRRSSTRSTSRASPRATPTCPSICAARMPGLYRRSRSATSARSA